MKTAHPPRHWRSMPRLGMLLQQPWAQLVADGTFPVLVRARPTRIRSRVAIVAHGADPNCLVDGRLPDPKAFPRRAIVGYVTIAGCVPVSASRIAVELRRLFGKELASFYPRHYFPRKSPAYLWILKKPKALVRPRSIPMTQNRGWIRLEPGPSQR